MKNKYINSVLLIVVLFIGIIYGMVMHKYEVFPYRFIRGAYRTIINQEQVSIKMSDEIEQDEFYNLWSIGIYEGSSPFGLSDAKGITNPVLTAKDVSDINANYIADPFLAYEDENYYMFFEVFNNETSQGDIGCAVSKDGLHWEYKKIVIDEPFHLSYPYIFKWNNEYYLIPESSQDYSVRLYKADSFPYKWQHVKNLLIGYPFVDPSLTYYNNKWWLFVTVPSSDILNIYSSGELLGTWKPHPLNPVVKDDKHHARPSGRVFEYKNRLYRSAQDDFPDYGVQVYAFEINELSESSYNETIMKNPIVKMTGTGWNAAGMHHVDPMQIGDHWIAVVDGRNRDF